MRDRVELFWTVWPSDVAAVHQVVQLLGAPNAQSLAPYLHTTKHRVILGGVTSRVATRPGTTCKPGNLLAECTEAGEAVGLVLERSFAKPVEELMNEWPCDYATVAQVRRFLNDRRRLKDLVEDLEAVGAKVLFEEVQPPGAKSRSRLVVLRGDVPPPTAKDYRVRNEDYVRMMGQYDACIKRLERLDQLKQAARLAGNVRTRD